MERSARVLDEYPMDRGAGKTGWKMGDRADALLVRKRFMRILRNLKRISEPWFLGFVWCIPLGFLSLWGDE